jgi:hypothetical protein
MPVGQLRYSRPEAIMMGTNIHPMNTKNHGWPKTTPRVRQTISIAAGASKAHTKNGLFKPLWASTYVWRVFLIVPPR